MSLNQPIPFVLVGGGWRAEFFLRIAEALPEKFRAVGAWLRNPDKRNAFESRWNIPAVSTLAELAAFKPIYAVVSVPASVSAGLIREAVGHNLAVLTETPPAWDLAQIGELHALVREGAKIQVAEQYPFRPQYQAVSAVIDSGILGTVTQAQVSVGHGYHGTALIRKFLSVGFENAKVSAFAFPLRSVRGPGRAGLPTEEKILEGTQSLALLEFQNKWGLFDFSGHQYFSRIRASRILIRGERGECDANEVRYLKDFKTPLVAKFDRCDTGRADNLSDPSLQGIYLGERILFQNPYFPTRFSDDEIAVATCMEKMGAYASGGPEFYSLAEGAQDHYLGTVIDEAARTGEKIETATQIWAH